MLRETVVYAFDDMAQRSELLDSIEPLCRKDRGLRVVALSMGSEITRMGLIWQALELYRDPQDCVDAIEAIMQWDDPLTWDFAKCEGN